MRYIIKAEEISKIKRNFNALYDETDGFLSKYKVTFSDFEPHYQCYNGYEFIMKYYDSEIGIKDLQFKFKFGYSKPLVENTLYLSFGTNDELFMRNISVKMSNAKFKYFDGIFSQANSGYITLKEVPNTLSKGVTFDFDNVDTLINKGPFYLLISDEPIDNDPEFEKEYNYQEEMHRKAIDEIIDSVIKENDEKKEYKNLAEFKEEFMENVRKEERK